MTEDDKTLVGRRRDEDEGGWVLTLCGEAADRIKALSAENERLREVLTQIEAGTYPRPLGKSWRMDLSSSKHDLCIHDRWMYETCDECLDAFVRGALGETK